MPTKKTAPKKKKAAVSKVVRKTATKATKKPVAKRVTAKKTAKKVVKKTAVKRSSKKSSSKMRAASSSCACNATCNPHEAFWVNNGPVIQTVQELTIALRTMSDEQFVFHTSRDGNDFARWVRECLQDEAKARGLEKAKSRNAAARACSGSCCKS